MFIITLLSRRAALIAPALLLLALCTLSPLAHAQSYRTLGYQALTPGAVQLKSGRALDGSVALRTSGASLNLLYVEDSGTRHTLPLSSVKSFHYGEQYVVNHGVVKKDRAMRTQVKEELIVRQLSGRLNLYAPLDQRSPDFPYTYFAKGDGMIQKVNYKNLRVALADNPESAALIASSRTWHRTHKVMFATGLATTLYGTFGRRSSSNVVMALVGVIHGDLHFRPDAVFITGVSTLALSYIPRAVKKIKFRKAIAAYNR